MTDNEITTEMQGSLGSISNDPLCVYDARTVHNIRKLYNFDNENDLNKAIDILDKWVKEQPHFRKKNFSRKYLEITLISLKGSIERSKKQLDRLCTLKTLLPRFYDISDPIDEFRCFEGKFQQTLLPKLTDENYRIYVSRFLTNGLNPEFYFKTLKFGIAMCEYIKSHDYCDGYVAIADYRNISITGFLSEISVSDMRQTVTLIMEGYQLRVKGIHLLTESTAIDLLVKLFKQLFSKKIAQRIHVHRNCESLHKFVPRDILPAELGGEEKSMDVLCENLMQTIGSEENVLYFKEMSEATVDERLRPAGREHKDLDMIGTFRTLSVD